MWPWSTLPVSRHGPLGEVITWRDLYKIDLWESHWDDALLQKRSVEQHIGAAWNTAPAQNLVGQIAVFQGYVNIFMGTPVQMTQAGYVAVAGVPAESFMPNRIRIALSYSAICGFLLVQKRKEAFEMGVSKGMTHDPVSLAVRDPEMRALAFNMKVGCGCRLVDWEHEDLGVKVIRLEDAEIDKFDRFR